MKTTPDNIFVGATVSLNQKTFCVLKVNAKTFYAAEGISFEQYQSMWDMRLKGTTFKAFCESKKFLQYKYSDGFEISKDETAKKSLIAESKKASWMPAALKKAINYSIDYLKDYLIITQTCGSEIFRILSEQDGIYVISWKGDWYLYNKEKNIDYKVGSITDPSIDPKNLPFDKVKI